MTFRPGPLRAAAILAGGFVVARVLYRLLFHGADGVGVVLLALPAIRLTPPFAHVVLLGPVTADGLWDAATSALPIALTILAFGLVNAGFDLNRLFGQASRRGLLRGIFRALAIASATLPSLAEGARAVRFAQRLRGERGGARILLPLFERTLERAGSIAAALELRGFAGRGLTGGQTIPVEAAGVTLGFGAPWATSGALVLPETLALRTGTLTVVAGPTGAGKSTLLRAIAGLHTHTDGGWIAGSLRAVGHDRNAVPPRDLAGSIGMVLQHPREAFVTERVRDEIGLALELRGVTPVFVHASVAEVAERVGIMALLDRPTRGLSAGEATLVAIAAAIVEHPALLLVDEPLADLDTAARARIAHLLGALAHDAGMCVVVAEHRFGALVGEADDIVHIDSRQVSVGHPVTSAGVVESTREFPIPPAPNVEHQSTVLSARGITVRYRDTFAVANADIDVRAGEIVALVGHNGAGKSSLLAALALPDRNARVEAAGRVAFVPDASDDLFIFDTVADECRRADRQAARRAGRVREANPAHPDQPTASRFAGFLGLDPQGPAFIGLLTRHPRDLSAGERRCLAIAIQLAGAPRALLIDEPSRGLGPAARELVWAALQALAAEGTGVLVATHEPDFVERAGRGLEMRSGMVAPAQTAAPVPATSVAAEASAAAMRATAPRTSQPGHPIVQPTNSGDEIGSAPELRRPHEASGASPTGLPRVPWQLPTLIAANLVALGAFCWPLVATAVPAQAHAAVPIAALALAPLAVFVVLATLDGTVRSAHMLALLGTLAAVGAAIRIASTGVGGVEAVFVLLILGGRAFGTRFGMLLGMGAIALSTLVTGTFGPWTPFQMFACAWVGGLAGLLPRRMPRPAEIAMLCAYGVIASYLFGLLMNLWFWPFAVGYGTGISYDGAAGLEVNLASFLLYSLVTSTLSWDTLRAITTVVGLILVGRPILAAMRRTKPLVGGSD
ncbi:MAG TPA: ATP-binding cassette domain-containing protein [Candidatus Lumbricidophila sp.]|nr:ATP-binding cassette domain-containing protein [Candidatus Lumbricidophila sp.]